MNCKKCIRCSETFPTDEMTTDAFGDHSVQMCNSCLNDLETDNSKYLLVRVPDNCGKTFLFKQELEELKRYVGAENVEIISGY